ncbi:hypothetical protein [Demequina aurantiaca]|uniref:hypothetical protein n=1 Tax=Demequina aurantiaca TaxID=676200 RepID=UPI003D326E55
MAKSMGTDSIVRATGVEWPDWMSHLELAGGRELSHTALAVVAERMMPANVASPEWWSQAVTVAYELEIGRRVPGQRADGTFEVAASRTLSGTLDDTFKTWMDLISDRDSFAGRELQDSPSTSSTAKWRRWRGKLDGGRTIVGEVGSRGDKSVLTVTVSKMADQEELEATRDFLKSLLANLPID